MRPARTGLGRLINAAGYSFKGLTATFLKETSFRQELALVLVLLAASFWLAGSALEWVVLVAPLIVLLIVELLNSAIESVVDRIGDELHVLSGQAKDMGSAAVLLSLVLIGACWGAVAWRHFLG